MQLLLSGQWAVGTKNPSCSTFNGTRSNPFRVEGSEAQEPLFHMNNRTYLYLAAGSLLLLAACKKEKNNDPLDNDYSAASDNAKAEDIFSDVLSQVDRAAEANGLRDMEDACAPVVTFDTVAFPHTMTVDFGEVNCTATNGKMRRGKLQVSYTGHYREPGTVITITPDNYYVDDNHVQGTKTITNMGHNDQGQTFFNVVVDGTITAADGSWTAIHHANRVRTWVEGENTPLFTDDVYLITGGGNGVNRHGNNYTVTITNPLRISMGCPFITAGTVQITPENKPTRTIDYGNGSCDGQITITVNGQSFTVIIG
jgi:hypothetical protein